MTAVAIAGIPYVRQDRSDASQRMCGAAALCMVYRSLGLACCQAEVWQRIARSNGRGIRRTRTYLLATDAVSRGLAAMVIQASEPWPLLFQCQEQGVKVILSHRLRPGSRSGHYTVLLGLNALRPFRLRLDPVHRLIEIAPSESNRSLPNRER